MFPFSLAGPAFLFFYAILAVALLCAFWFYAGSTAESAAAAGRLNDLTSDPYRIGYLRGAREETVRLAIVNLVDRGILEYSGLTLKATDRANTDSLRRPLDRAIVAQCARPASFGTVLDDPKTRAACEDYARELEAAGLLRDENRQRAVFKGLVAVAGLLGGLALARIVQALSHGRFNIFFLVALGAVAIWFAYRIYSNRLTFEGGRRIRSLQTLMGRLKARANSLDRGGTTNEALLLAAIFGLYALPDTAFPFVEQLFPRPRPSDSGSWSSDGSSSSDGGSCGGGGGSGCGGCGGGGD